MKCVILVRFEAAAEGYRKVLNQECVGSTPQNSPTHLITEENTSSPVKQVGKTEIDEHVLGFMADQVGGIMQLSYLPFPFLLLFCRSTP
jgi:hypothetical protein